MADHQRRDGSAAGGLNNAPRRTQGGLNNAPQRRGSHASSAGAAAPRTVDAQLRGAGPQPQGAAGRSVASPQGAAAGRSVASGAAAHPQASRRQPAPGAAQHRRPASSAGSRRPQPGRAAARPTPAGAGVRTQAQAYRRTNDGSGYRPVQPGGKGGAPKKKGGPWRVVFWIALAVLVVSLAVLGALFFSYWQGQNAYDKIADQAFEAPADIEGTALEDLQVDWDALRAINPDVVGWVYIPGTIVNYPIVHTDNDERYLTYDFNGQQGWGATFGTIFLQAANAGDFSDANNIVYGHHLNNGSMFACLADMTDDAGFNAHRTVYVLTPQGNYKLRTFSLVHCAADDPLAQTSFADSAAQTAYVQDKIDRSTAAPEGQLPAAEDIDHTFAFVTCDNLPSDGRYVLFSYVEDSTVAGQHAAGSDAVSADRQATEDAAQQAVSAASEELAAA